MIEKFQTEGAIGAGGGGGGGGGGSELEPLTAGEGYVGFSGPAGQVDRITIPANGFTDIILTGPSRGGLIAMTYQNAAFPEPGLVVAGPGQASNLHVGLSRELIPSVYRATYGAGQEETRELFQLADVSIRVYPFSAPQQDGTGPVIGFGDLLVTVTRSFHDQQPAAKFILVDRQPIAASGADEVMIRAIPIQAPGSNDPNKNYNAYLSVRIYNTTDADIVISSGHDNYMAGMRSGIVARSVPAN